MNLWNFLSEKQTAIMEGSVFCGQGDSKQQLASFRIGCLDFFILVFIGQRQNFREILSYASYSPPPQMQSKGNCSDLKIITNQTKKTKRTQHCILFENLLVHN